MNAVEQCETLAALFGSLDAGRQHLADGNIGSATQAAVLAEDALNALRAAGWIPAPAAAELGRLWDEALAWDDDLSTSSGPVGVAWIRAGDMSGCVTVELDQDGAEALGLPSHVLVELAARLVTIMPCVAGDIGARSTVATRDGGLAFDARVSGKRRAFGRWPVWAHGGGLVVDLAGDQARRAV